MQSNSEMMMLSMAVEIAALVSLILGLISIFGGYTWSGVFLVVLSLVFLLVIPRIRRHDDKR